MLSEIEKIFFALLTFIIMMGIGTTLTAGDFKKSIQAPRPILSGLFSQIFWMPLIAYGLCIYLDLPTYSSIGLILLGCTPGGALSNIFAHFSRANVALSICMTFFSTISAFIFMPLLIFYYTRNLSLNTIQIPYSNIFASLAFLLLPVIFGMIINKNYQEGAKKVERFSTYAGIIIIAYLLISGLINNGKELRTISTNEYISVIILQLSGFLFGFIVSLITRISTQDRKAVCLETGIQNVPLTFTVILLSFHGQQQEAILRIPLLYALSTVIFSTILSQIFRLQTKKTLT